MDVLAHADRESGGVAVEAERRLTAWLSAYGRVDAGVTWGDDRVRVSGLSGLRFRW